MLLGDPAKIIALDLNPAQNELLRLKIAAFQTLQYDELLAYLGVTPSVNRLETHVIVAKALPQASGLFWESRKKLIKNGI